MSEQKSENGGRQSIARFKNIVVIVVVAGCCLFVGLVFCVDTDKVVETFARFKWGCTPLILPPTLFVYLLRFYKWDYYLKNTGIRLSIKYS